MKIGEFTDAFERMALNESLKESFKILKGEEEYAYEDLGNAGINPKDVEAYAGGDDGDVFYIIFKDGSKKVFFNHAGMTQSAAECGLDNDEEVENFESFELYESFKDPIRKRSRRVNEAFDYDQAVAYIESKGIGCDPCQDIEGEHVCDLLDELGGGLGSEDYSKEELDRIVSSALEFKKDAETWDDDFEGSLKEDYTVWFETPGGDADIAGTYKDRETAELVASDLDDSWIEETKNESFKLNEEGNTSKRVTQISIDLLWDPEAYPDYDPKSLMEDIESEIEASDIGMTVLGYDFEDLTSTYINQYPDLLESKQVLPIRKVLQGSDIMSIIDRNPREAIKKAIEIVSNSNEVSDKDKYEFKRNMQGNLNKAISTLATYFYDVNKAKI